MGSQNRFSAAPDGVAVGGGACASSSGLSTSNIPGTNTGACIICREAGCDTVCLPCGHLLICFRCSLRYVLPNGNLDPSVRCPCCKQSVQTFQRVFLQSPNAMARYSQMQEMRSLP